MFSQQRKGRDARLILVLTGARVNAVLIPNLFQFVGAQVSAQKTGANLGHNLGAHLPNVFRLETRDTGTSSMSPPNNVQARGELTGNHVIRQTSDESNLIALDRFSGRVRSVSLHVSASQCVLCGSVAAARGHRRGGGDLAAVLAGAFVASGWAAASRGDDFSFPGRNPRIRSVLHGSAAHGVDHCLRPYGGEFFRGRIDRGGAFGRPGMALSLCRGSCGRCPGGGGGTDARRPLLARNALDRSEEH